MEDTLTDRLAVRRAQSAPVVAELKGWLDAMTDRVLPQSALGKAVSAEHFEALPRWNVAG